MAAAQRTIVVTPQYPFIVSSTPDPHVTELNWRGTRSGRGPMNYTSFTNLRSSTQLPVHSVDAGAAAPGRCWWRQVGCRQQHRIAARNRCGHLAAVLYFRLILLEASDSAQWIQESLLISTLPSLVSIGLRQYSRLQTQPRQMFLWCGVLLAFSFFLSTTFILKGGRPTAPRPRA